MRHPQDICEAVTIANGIKNPYATIFKRRYWPQLIITILIPAFQQLTGINAIMCARAGPAAPATACRLGLKWGGHVPPLSRVVAWRLCAVALAAVRSAPLVSSRLAHCPPCGPAPQVLCPPAV